MRQRIPIYHSMTLENCADYLLNNKLAFDKKYYNIKIKGKISPEPIREMVKLPYEITIYRVKDENRLMTGTRYGGAKEDDIEENNIVCIMKRSFFNLHTHPPKGHAKFDSPSFKDLLSDFLTKEKRAIAHSNGLLIYGTCQRDLKNNILSYEKSIDDEYLEDMVRKFLKKEHITLFEDLPGHKNIADISLALKDKYQKEFTMLTRPIKDEASWDDKKNIDRIIKKIFGEYAE